MPLTISAINDTHTGKPADFDTIRPKRIGLLGGSFNPAHGGHRHIALAAQKALLLDEVWFLVSPLNPLKNSSDMAPLPARFRSAAVVARRAKIKVTAIETEIKTRYSADTLKALSQRYKKWQFVWLMGGDNLSQFHHWKNWKTIARMMPIAVIARPGYESQSLASPAGAWLRKYRISASQFTKMGQWSTPALVTLCFNPDNRSASAIRLKQPDWAQKMPLFPIRDQVTRRIINDNNTLMLPDQHGN